jgi:hypothetical protein
MLTQTREGSGKLKVMTVMAVFAAAMLLVSPIIVGFDAASDDNKVVHVSVYTGTSFQYDDIAAPVGSSAFNYITLDGPMAQYMTLSGTSVVGKVPYTLGEGEFDLRIIGHSDSFIHTKTVKFHVRENPVQYNSANIDKMPSIDKVGTSTLGAQGKITKLSMKTTNADSVSVDYNDGIMTSPIQVQGGDTISTHTYSAAGTYAIKIVASNDYGSDELVLIYQQDEVPDEETVTEEQTETGFDIKKIAMAAVIALVVAGVIIIVIRR